MTNQEWIQSMNSNQLSLFIRRSSLSPCDVCFYRNDCYDEGTEEDFCLLGVKLWLEEEHKDEEH